MLQKLENYLKKSLKNVDLSEVVDIMLFGSVVKGKEFPEDIDLCVIFRKKINLEVINKISSKIKNINVHISSLNVDNFFRKPHSLAKTVLIEGKSVLTGRRFIQNFGFSSAFIYSYNLSNLKHSYKVRFVYLLKGRKGNIGVIKKFGGEWLADSCFILSLKNDDEIMNIFKKWGVNYIKKEVFIH